MNETEPEWDDEPSLHDKLDDLSHELGRTQLALSVLTWVVIIGLTVICFIVVSTH